MVLGGRTLACRRERVGFTSTPRSSRHAATMMKSPTSRDRAASLALHHLAALGSLLLFRLVIDLRVSGVPHILLLQIHLSVVIA